MALLTSNEKAEAVRTYERQTTGTNELHRALLGLIHTDGIKFLAETCKAWWLVDLVASWQPHIRAKHPNLADFQVWRLTKRKKEEHGWIVDAWSDTPACAESKRLCVQAIEYSDFPEELSGFEFYCENNTILLKGER